MFGEIIQGMDILKEINQRGMFDLYHFSRNLFKLFLAYLGVRPAPSHNSFGIADGEFANAEIGGIPMDELIVYTCGEK